MKRFILALTILFLLAAPAYGASTASDVGGYGQAGPLSYVDIAWTAHTDGTFTAWTTTNDVSGFIYAIETDPGSTAPTANYDILITNDLGRLVCGDSGTVASPGGDGAGANKSATVSEYSSMSSVASKGKLTINIKNNSVNGATGLIRIWYLGTS